MVKYLGSAFELRPVIHHAKYKVKLNFNDYESWERMQKAAKVLEECAQMFGEEALTCRDNKFVLNDEKRWFQFQDHIVFKFTEDMLMYQMRFK